MPAKPDALRARVVFRLTPEDRERLDVAADLHGITVGELCRLAAVEVAERMIRERLRDA